MMHESLRRGRFEPHLYFPRPGAASMALRTAATTPRVSLISLVCWLRLRRVVGHTDVERQAQKEGRVR